MCNGLLDGLAVVKIGGCKRYGKIGLMSMTFSMPKSALCFCWIRSDFESIIQAPILLVLYQVVIAKFYFHRLVFFLHAGGYANKDLCPGSWSR